MSSAVLEISVDGPHGAPGTHVHRIDDLGEAGWCDRVAQKLEEAKRLGRSHYTVRDHRGGEVVTLPLHRVTGVRVLRPDLDRALPEPDPNRVPDTDDRKSAAAGG